MSELIATVVHKDGTTEQVPYPPAREPEELSCGHMSTPTQIWPGYAVTSDDRHICANCAADLDREQVTNGGELFAYVGKDMNFVNLSRRIDIITWAGVKLGTGIASRETRDGLGNKVRYVTAEIAGTSMYGRHYPDAGDYIRLHPNKRQS